MREKSKLKPKLSMFIPSFQFSITMVAYHITNDEDRMIETGKATTTIVMHPVIKAKNPEKKKKSDLREL